MRKDTKSLDVLEMAEKIKGAKKFLGECSHQIHFELKDGRVLRIGVTDDDCCEMPGLWIDDKGWKK